MEANELKEFIQQLFENRSIKTDMEFKLIRQELQTIKEQVLKTNGRVTALENEFYEFEKTTDNHYHVCPNNAKIRDIQDTLLSRKSIRQWLIAGLSITSGIIALYFLILKLLKLGKMELIIYICKVLFFCALGGYIAYLVYWNLFKLIDENQRRKNEKFRRLKD